MPNPLTPTAGSSRALPFGALLLGGWLCVAWAGPRPPLQLHVPSPDWRDQVIYFAVTDRFDDGNPHNNDQGAGEFDPRQSNRYSGGDLAGLLRRLGYIQGLGATTLWITPPVANQWVNAQGTYSGYHGYWTQDFTKVDPHLGSLQDYRLLSDGLHRRGMYLVQDIVVNHVGDYFFYGPERDPKDPTKGWRANDKARPTSAPTQFPFNLNDPRRTRDRTAAIYHWTPDVANYQDREQELTHQMSGLDDLNTRNLRVREALRSSYAHWIREVGVDAYRVDTAFYVEPEFFEDFMWAKPATAGSPTSRQTPGMDAVARATGRRDFFMFGEGFGIDAPGQDKQGRKIELYMHAAEGAGATRRMNGMLNFPLYGALGDVMARGAPTALLADRVRQQVRLHPRLLWMPSFVDNHDVDRFLAAADERALLQALGALFTLPGIPVLYYGTEQGFTQQRASMFAAGWGSGGRDHFNTEHRLYRQIKAMADLRRNHAALRRGTVEMLAETMDDAGALVWRRVHEGQQVVVALNTADEPITLTGLPIGDVNAALQPTWGLDGEPTAPLRTDAQGRASVVLPARSMKAWAGSHAQSDTPPAKPLELRAAPADAAWQLRADRSDPVGDDHGPQGRYRYPSDAAYAAKRPADIHRVRVETRDEGGSQAMRVSVTMNELSTVWSPRNGFDHVAFTLFIELPKAEGGSTLMPLQNGALPEGLHWHRRVRSHGWSLALFDSADASATHEGRPLNRGVKVHTDSTRRTVTFTLSASALGRPAQLSGARIWINTWDWDGTYRTLQPQAADFSFGGGEGHEPKWMDASDVITLP